ELRVEDVLAVDIADARAADRAEERNTRDGERRRRTDQRDHVGIVLEIVAQHGADDLRLVEKARGEKRPDRAIDEARGQHLFLGRAPFALEEAARNLAGGEGLFLIVDRERKEFLPRLLLLIGDSGAEHRGFAVCRHHGAIGLPRDFAGLEDEASAAPHQFFSIYLEHDRVLSLLSWLSGEKHKGAARATFPVVAAQAPVETLECRCRLSGGAPDARSVCCSARRPRASGNRAGCGAGRPSRASRVVNGNPFDDGSDAPSDWQSVPTAKRL